MARDPPTVEEREALVSSFLEVAIGQDPDIAVRFLQRARWRIEEALQQFFTNGNVVPPPVAVEAAAAVVFEEDLRFSALGDETPEGHGMDDHVGVLLPERRGTQHDDGSVSLFPQPPVAAFSNKKPQEYGKGDDVCALHESQTDNNDSVSVVQESVVDFIMEPVGSAVKKPFCLRGEIYMELRPHQRDGLQWFWDNYCAGRGGILGDDMGVGKTRQVSSFLAGLLQSQLIKNALIVVPPILMDQWVKEMSKVGLHEEVNVFKDPKTRIGILQKVIKNGGILICSMGLIPGQWKVLSGAVKWDYVIVDEGHKINRSKTKLFSSLENICCSHRILITGTPIQNTLKELHILLSFCCPGFFGSLEEFVENFLGPIVDGNFKESTNEQLIESSVAASKLRELMKPYMLRRMKDEISSLPEKTELTVWLELTPYQQKLYRAFLRSNLINKREKGEALVATMLLGKICNHPNKLTINDANEDTLEHLHKAEKKLLNRLVSKFVKSAPVNDAKDKEYYNSCKVEFTLKLLAKLYEDHKVLIFSQTRETLDIIQAALSDKEFKFYRIDGRTKPAERQNIVNAFKEVDGAPILLLSTRVGGTGLDLSVATRAIIIDPSWNPSVDNQCADRIYRIGQEKNVFIYRLIATSTVEQYMYETQLFKAGLFKMATEDADYKRYIHKHVNDELFEMPFSFSTSRIQRKLVQETLKGVRTKEVQGELLDLKKCGFSLVSIHNRLFSETIELPKLTDGSWREKRSIKQRSSHRVDRDYVVGGADFSFNPKHGPVEIQPALPLPEDEEETRSRKAERVIYLKEEITRYTFILKTHPTNDGGLKLKAHIEKCRKEIFELELDEDCRQKDQT